MRSLIMVACTCLFFVQSSFALGHFTLTTVEVGTYVQQCKPDLSKQEIESEVKSGLATLAISLSSIQTKSNLKEIVGNVKTRNLGATVKATVKALDSKLTEYVELDGLMFKGISSSDLDVVDILTKHFDSQKTYYKDEYPVKKTISGNTTYIQRFCQTYICKDRKQMQPFSLKTARPQTTMCSDALCALKQIYGEEKGPLILYAYLKYKLNLAPKADINADPDGFNIETLAAVLTAAASVPRHLHSKILEQKYFYRFLKGRTLKMYGSDNRVVANASGAVFDSIDDYDFNEKVYVFLHEMGHRAASQSVGGDLDASADWLRVALTGDEISKYSLKNAAENFAETFALYRLYPEKLSASSAARYAFMKIMVFKEIDYRDNLCEGRAGSLR